MANVESLAKLSADAHVDEPHYLWYERLDESNRDFAPRRIESNVEGGWCLIVDGNDHGWSNISSDQAATREQDRLDAVTQEVRNQDDAPRWTQW
jgi:hypothetical protein